MSLQVLVVSLQRMNAKMAGHRLQEEEGCLTNTTPYHQAWDTTQTPEFPNSFQADRVKMAERITWPWP